MASLAKRVMDPFGLFSRPSRREPLAQPQRSRSGDKRGGLGGGGDDAEMDTVGANAAELRALLAASTAAAATTEVAEATTGGVRSESHSGTSDYGGECLSEDLMDDAGVEEGSEEKLDKTSPAGHGSGVGGGSLRVVGRRASLPRPGHHQPMGGGKRVGGSSLKTAYPMDIYEDDMSYELQVCRTTLIATCKLRANICSCVIAVLCSISISLMFTLALTGFRASH